MERYPDIGLFFNILSGWFHSCIKIREIYDFMQYNYPCSSVKITKCFHADHCVSVRSSGLRNRFSSKSYIILKPKKRLSKPKAPYVQILLYLSFSCETKPIKKWWFKLSTSSKIHHQNKNKHFDSLSNHLQSRKQMSQFKLCKTFWINSSHLQSAKQS